jgi:FKBP-type peptidyl-prolyl cis-trans isomerase SlyD
MISNGKKISIAYNLRIDGKLIKSISASKPLRYVHGKRQISAGLEKALRGLKVGDRKEFILSPKEAHGIENPKSFIEMPKARFPKRDHFIGKELTSPKDGKFLATVKEIKQNSLVLNFNHPFAGKKLHYEVLVISIEGEGNINLKKEEYATTLSKR